MPEVLRAAVVGGSTLVAPAPVWDPVTAAAIDAEREAAERRGYERGVADGRTEAAAALARTAAALTAALDGLHAELVDQRRTAIAADLELVRTTVEAVLDEAPPTSALALLGRITEAAAMLDDPVLEVRLHPEDLAVLDGADLDPRLQLVPDAAVALGEATVAGTWGRADLRRARLREVALAQLTAVTDDASVPTADGEVTP